MKAKEEAKELVEEYLNIEFCLFSDSQAKQRALIYVDEILQINAQFYFKDYAYWQEVKQEIEKL